jgi:hypothetical protein
MFVLQPYSVDPGGFLVEGGGDEKVLPGKDYY